MTTEPQTDFDGCNSECRKAGAHTLRWGGCEHAPKPEPTVSMSMIYKDPEDGYPSIGFDSYTVAELVDLIEPALRRVHARIGPNALAMLQRGETVALSGGEYADLAREAAHAIVHRNDDQTAAAPVTVPPTDRAGLRDWIADAVVPLLLDTLPKVIARSRGYEVADAVLALLPAPVDRSAVLREAADRIGELRIAEQEWLVACGFDKAEQELRRLADEEQQCPHGCDISHCPCLACEAEQAEAEARPPRHTWEVESPRRDNWASWGTTYDDRDWATERYESAIGHAPARPFRLVRATTTYTVEAEHTPATETQVVPPREPHPTEADLRHALAVAAKFHGQATTAPAVVAEPGKER